MKSLALQEAGWMAAKPLADDIQLIKRIGRGDRQALSELYARYQRVLFAYLLQLTPDYGLAEELLQDTLVAVWKSAHSFEGRSSVLTWLIGIARRQAHNTLRQRRLPLTDLSEIENMAATDLEPEEVALAGIARAELTEAFRRLAPVHREVLLLTFVQELSYQETATILEIPLGTVKSRLNNARRALRALLDAKEDTKR
ncbi:MAG TPA: sigma-70 family RNA polymerase sigma factor [Ktedonobacteraceae bacterium]